MARRVRRTDLAVDDLEGVASGLRGCVMMADRGGSCRSRYHHILWSQEVTQWILKFSRPARSTAPSPLRMLILRTIQSRLATPFCFSTYVIVWTEDRRRSRHVKAL